MRIKKLGLRKMDITLVQWREGWRFAHWSRVTKLQLHDDVTSTSISRHKHVDKFILINFSCPQVEVGLNISNVDLRIIDDNKEIGNLEV
jgi:hypothetical protein